MARDQGAKSFDVEGANLGYIDGRCSFESILVEFDLKDRALRRMGDIVQGADVDAVSDRASEASGLKAIAMRFRKEHGARDDEKRGQRHLCTTPPTRGARMR